METLEQLKSIIDGAVDGDLFYDGRYLNEKLHVRGEIDKYSIKRVKSHIVYDAPLYVNTGKLRSLSDIKLIIELMEEISGLKHKVGYVIEHPHSKDNYDLGA